MIRLYDKNINETSQNIGEMLWASLPFFANVSKLLTSKMQLTIQKFRYCELTNTPPHPCLNSTPATVIDDFTTISDEISWIKQEQKEANNGG
tara:strand:+ start:2559 stop:2834 length:276 start_codon:yes stop_codon:yes gene_type:complete